VTRVLVVEDEPDIALGLEQDLRLDGYHVEILNDGQHAIDRAGRDTFDLILLDVGLPGKDGFAVCRELRRAGTLTPIIVLTARDQEADKIQGLELGADDYVTKPFSPAELRARIRSILRHRKEWHGDGVRLDRELRTAAEVQQRLFPQVRPHSATLDYVGYCQPALRVGGDYYDYLALPGDRLVLLLADVAGKGASAALVMASLHGCIRAHAAQHDGRCDQVMRMANALLHQATDTKYATVFYAVYDTMTRELHYVNAGHPAPLVARSGELVALESGCTPIGLFESIEPMTASIQLQPGDRVLLFSDGVTDARNADNVEFGGARTGHVLLTCGAQSAVDIRDALLTELRAHTAGCPPFDDVTLIAGVVR
jgi:phosphoserine phosphatase RsbU/P